MSTQRQTSLFSGPSLDQPAETFTSHETLIVDADGRQVDPSTPGARVRVRLLVQGSVDEPIPTGPLTYEECMEWDVPCMLYACRYRLDDAVEVQTRSTDRDGDVTPGWWCALHVVEAHPDADEDGSLSVRALGRLLGKSKADVEREVALAVKAYEGADAQMGAEAPEYYGDRGRMHSVMFQPEGPQLTEKEAARAVVPGEEKSGRKAPRVGRNGIRVWGSNRKDPWAGVKRRVPDEFVRGDGTAIKTVDASFLSPAMANDTIPEQCSDMKAMLAARAAQVKARAEREAA